MTEFSARLLCGSDQSAVKDWKCRADPDRQKLHLGWWFREDKKAASLYCTQNCTVLSFL